MPGRCGARSRRRSTSASSRSPSTRSRPRTGRGLPTRSSRSWSSWTRRSTASFPISRSRGFAPASSGAAIASRRRCRRRWRGSRRRRRTTSACSLWIAFDYGRRAELVEAARRLLEDGVRPRTCPRRPWRRGSTRPSSPTPTSSSARPASSGSRTSCSGSRRTRSSSSTRRSGRTSARNGFARRSTSTRSARRRFGAR